VLFWQLLDIPSACFPRRFPAKILHAFLFFLLYRFRRPYFINLTGTGDLCKSGSSFSFHIFKQVGLLGLYFMFPLLPSKNWYFYFPLEKFPSSEAVNSQSKNYHITWCRNIHHSVHKILPLVPRWARLIEHTHNFSKIIFNNIPASVSRSPVWYNLFQLALPIHFLHFPWLL
jgi:hypothetical protein